MGKDRMQIKIEQVETDFSSLCEKFDDILRRPDPMRSDYLIFADIIKSIQEEYSRYKENFNPDIQMKLSWLKGARLQFDRYYNTLRTQLSESILKDIISAREQFYRSRHQFRKDTGKMKRADYNMARKRFLLDLETAEKTTLDQANDRVSQIKISMTELETTLSNSPSKKALEDVREQLNKLKEELGSTTKKRLPSTFIVDIECREQYKDHMKEIKALTKRQPLPGSGIPIIGLFIRAIGGMIRNLFIKDTSLTGLMKRVEKKIKKAAETDPAKIQFKSIGSSSNIRRSENLSRGSSSTLIFGMMSHLPGAKGDQNNGFNPIFDYPHSNPGNVGKDFFNPPANYERVPGFPNYQNYQNYPIEPSSSQQYIHAYRIVPGKSQMSSSKQPVPSSKYVELILPPPTTNSTGSHNSPYSNAGLFQPIHSASSLNNSAATMVVHDTGKNFGASSSDADPSSKITPTGKN